ncbi:hypothetical protein ABBQ38_014969 [Trebouxia sp. C0009 RCD-2024]
MSACSSPHALHVSGPNWSQLVHNVAEWKAATPICQPTSASLAPEKRPSPRLSPAPTPHAMGPPATYVPDHGTADAPAPTGEVPSAAAVATSVSKHGVEAPNMHPEGPGVQGQTAGVAVKLTKAAKRRTAKRQTQDKKKAGADKKAADYTALKAVDMATVEEGDAAGEPEGAGAQGGATDHLRVVMMGNPWGQGRATNTSKHLDQDQKNNDNGAAREGNMDTLRSRRSADDGTGIRSQPDSGGWSGSSASRAVGEGQGFLAAMNGTAHKGSMPMPPQALEQAQAAAARALKLTPTDPQDPTHPLSCQSDASKRPDGRGVLKATSQPQGCTGVGPQTLRQAQAAAATALGSSRITIHRAANCPAYRQGSLMNRPHELQAATQHQDGVAHAPQAREQAQAAAARALKLAPNDHQDPTHPLSCHIDASKRPDGRGVLQATTQPQGSGGVGPQALRQAQAAAARALGSSRITTYTAANCPSYRQGSFVNRPHEHTQLQAATQQPAVKVDERVLKQEDLLATAVRHHKHQPPSAPPSLYARRPHLTPPHSAAVKTGEKAADYAAAARADTRATPEPRVYMPSQPKPHRQQAIATVPADAHGRLGCDASRRGTRGCFGASLGGDAGHIFGEEQGPSAAMSNSTQADHYLDRPHDQHLRMPHTRSNSCNDDSNGGAREGRMDPPNRSTRSTGNSSHRRNTRGSGSSAFTVVGEEQATSTAMSSTAHQGRVQATPPALMQAQAAAARALNQDQHLDPTHPLCRQGDATKRPDGQNARQAAAQRQGSRGAGPQALRQAHAAAARALQHFNAHTDRPLNGPRYHQASFVDRPDEGSQLHVATRHSQGSRGVGPQALRQAKAAAAWALNPLTSLPTAHRAATGSSYHQDSLTRRHGEESRLCVPTQPQGPVLGARRPAVSRLSQTAHESSNMMITAAAPGVEQHANRAGAAVNATLQA